MTAVRIGNASGFYGDRRSAFAAMLEGGDLDYLTGDYLAELTMLILGRDKLKDESLGYAKTFVRQLEDCLGLAVDKGVRIVTNAGGLNPAGLADRLRQIAAEQGISASIAHVEGDDLLPRADDLGFAKALTANAYLGAFGIAEALRGGADVVVTGRITDASLVVGPAIAHHDWSRTDYDALAGAVAAGHVIECGTQATGGNVAGFEALDLTTPQGRQFGFPIAEVEASGDSVITKHPGTGGAVTLDTVTAQLVYEIDSPAYLGPDVVARLDSLALVAEGPDRVAISGVRGSAPPPQAKVCLNRLGGFRNSVEFLLTGLDIDAKASLVREQLTDALSSSPPDSVEWQLERTSQPDPATQAEATARLRCEVRSSSPEAVGRAFSGAAVELALGSIPGFTLTAPPGSGSPYGVYAPAYVDQDVPEHCVVHADGSRTPIPPPPESGSMWHRSNRSQPMPHRPRDQRALSRTTRAPLGRIAYARSGDKGGDSNVGVWVRSDHPRAAEAYDWLRTLLDEKAVRQLLPEAADLEIDVYELPDLRAVNIVLHGLLGEGVAASTRFDPQAKAVGEWLRARQVDVPTELLMETP
ncbi:acyclic terpene utilization AtuA family protein [Solicola gregarius]|uniref:DUF1446 domain-containing protein n=1 Tax=Solicola gregarius TaxID=2908642 RepID=A0AA46YP08_9ACTN|nr:acyclic terpene utilization AtuA family protein [Solicola gregarius]UYM07168.1 DUF1446 domain-containing protein [Solicola gregarius]